MAKIPDEEEDGRGYSAHTHYSSSSYSLGGQTATTRSIQSCGEKLCDSGGMLSGRAHLPLTPVPMPGHYGPGPASWIFSPWKVGPGGAGVSSPWWEDSHGAILYLWEASSL